MYVDEGVVYVIPYYDGNADLYRVSGGAATLVVTIAQSVIASTVGMLGWSYDNGILTIVRTQSSGTGNDRTFIQRIAVTAVSNGTALSEVVSDICLESGLASGDINVTGLATKTVYGYSRGGISTGRAMIEALRPAYFFDAYEDDWQLKFKFRGSASAYSITDDDLGGDINATTTIRSSYQTSRSSEVDLPREARVSYQDKDNYYRPTVQTAMRQTGYSNNVLDLSLPLALDNDDGAQISEIVLFDAWRSRESHAFSLTRKWSALKPSDVVTITEAGNTHVVRINEIEDDGVLRIKATTESPSSYTSTATGQGGPATTYDLTPIVPTVFVKMEIPQAAGFTDLDRAGYFVAAAGLSDKWSGCNVYAKYSGGFVYDYSISKAAKIGTATTALPNAITETFDRGSTLDVKMISGTLSSIDEETWLAGESNRMAISGATGWEIITFKNATDNGDGEYTLDTFIRGQFGTEAATAGHADGDRVVILHPTSLVDITTDITDIGTVKSVRVASAGLKVSEGDAYTITNSSVRLKPLSPAHLAAVDAGGGNYTVTWLRRGRVDGEWLDSIDVPAPAEAENYSVYVYDSGGTLKSTATVLGVETATVAAVPTDVIKVAQVSAYVGDGFLSEYTIT
jgi:hypothetical protein